MEFLTFNDDPTIHYGIKAIMGHCFKAFKFPINNLKIGHVKLEINFLEI
jgi:hypothetical protein